MRVVKYSREQLKWYPVSDRDKDGNTTDRLYMGQLVICGAEGVAADNRWPDDGGVMPLAAADGAADTTNEGIICGIVYGTNNRDRVIDTTYEIEYIDSVTSQANINARNVRDTDAHHPLGDRIPMVQVHKIGPDTTIEIPIYNAVYGTAISVLTSTAVSQTSVTTNACDFTPVANLCSIHCRSGASKGQTRQTDDASTTIPTWDRAMSGTIVVGDTFVRVPLRPQGPCYIQLDAESLFIDGSASPATNYYIFHVDHLLLDDAGNEKVVGRFDPIHFMATRA